MQFPQKLDFLIGLRGTNQSQLSRKTGISQSAISEMTKGKRRVYMDQAFELARALGVSLDYLADDAQEEPPAIASTNYDVVIKRLVEVMGEDEAIRRLAGVSVDDGGPAESAQEEPPANPGRRGKTA
ncbi:helix-turn-helix domain-containing protein [Tundrisphaera lichenicola]|uniref:helix-turn-helix domain-containing protein n=1 Tax=Tundrisphaera lichenicola TaxID=2029860 RepID=UPI003EC0CAEC